uniref:Ig-like domain-containing protein n=1 Tax=Neogobius melanostomus TaxID=47308 RepID=A0A8C6TD71_9GOBI
MMKCICLFFSDYATMLLCKEGVTINTPSPMEALSGSCLNIPCTYTGLTIDPEKSFTGIWSKTTPAYGQNAANVISVSGDSSKSYPMNITGNLKNRDCTTMFHDLTQRYEDNYFFRIENGPNKVTAACTNLQIRVRDSPWSPSIEVSGEQIEANVVTITCSAVTPCPSSPPRLTWDHDKDPVNNVVQNPDGTFTTTVTYKLSLTSPHDGCNLTCSAEYPVNHGKQIAKTTITLNVTPTYGKKPEQVSFYYGTWSFVFSLFITHRSVFTQRPEQTDGNRVMEAQI